MRARVYAAIAFDVDIPVEDDNAGWQATDKGGRMLEQQLIWEETMPQLVKHGILADNITAQVSISETPPSGARSTQEALEKMMGRKLKTFGRGMHVPAKEST